MARGLLLGALGAVLIGGLALLSRALFSAPRVPQAVPALVEAPPAEPAPAPPIVAEPPAPELEAHVTQVQGNAEVFVPGDGRWQPVSVGQLLGPDAVLRTKQGHVVFGIGPGVEVSVSRG